MKTSKFGAGLLSLLMLGSFGLAACGNDKEKETENQGEQTYNVIFTLATIPPVLAAMDCIDNGYETYAVIERGKTYSGIESVEKFHNVGFDVNSNKSTGFTAEEFNSMVDKVKELDALKGDAFFNIYVQDGTALKGAAIAANAGLSLNQFHIYMCEDGTGAYNALNNNYVRGKKVTAEADEIYDNYVVQAQAAKAEFETIMSKTNNKNSDAVLNYNIGKAYALASLDNFTYYIQDEATVVGILENTGEVKTKLLSSFGVEGYYEEVDYTLNLKYQKISEGIDKLTDAERTDYLTLMYGDYYEDTYTALTRTERAGETAPEKKLVFIGSRHGGYPHLASKAQFGIGGLSDGASVPASYEALDDKYKMDLLFATEEDYNAFLAVLNNAENYSADVTDEAKNKAQVACFNTYIDYIYTLKFTYAVYGAEYDLIMKGHPREAIGCWADWGNRYKVTYGEEQSYCYDKLLDTALLAFHAQDSVGKYIGMVPYGTAAENLAYLGANIAIGGLPSSTYNGYDTDVDVLFILAETSEDIIGSGKDTAASQVKERYEAGNLLYTGKDGYKQTTVFYNIGNTYKTIAEILADTDSAASAKFYGLYKDWLKTTHAGADDIDEQGFAMWAE